MKKPNNIKKKNDFVYVFILQSFPKSAKKMFNQVKYYMRKDEPTRFDLIKYIS